MEINMEDNMYKLILKKFGISGTGVKIKFLMIFIPFTICWLPLAIMTLINGTFWTGEIKSSFITNFDTQARFLIAMPIFILAEKLVSSRLGAILKQFISSGIILDADRPRFESIIHKQTGILNSDWTNFVVMLICYLQVFLVVFYESSNTSFLSWQLVLNESEPALNAVGKWSTLISRPFLLFLFYKWMLRVIIWGNILRKISNLNIQLFPEHPDLSGGIGYLGYALRYFSPVTFAISCVVAGNMADFMLIEGFHVAELKLPAIGYFIFITLLFTLPMLSFTKKMIEAKEASIFENNDFANGMYKELHKTIAKKHHQVTHQDLNSSVYAAISDYNAVVDNVLKMKYLPFTLKDMVPLWITTALPFLMVALLEIPISSIFNNIVSLIV